MICAHANSLRRGFRHRLVLIGHGPDKSALKSLAAEQGVSDSVLFMGRLDNPYPVVAQSSVLCASSRYEGRSLVLSEAAALGVPVIAANCPTGAREVLADGRYGELVETESVSALSEAIENHLRDPWKLISKAEASANDVDRLSIKTCAKHYISLIRQHLP